MIAVVDYGAGNLMSVCNALDYLGLKNRVTKSPLDLEGADGIILPGVGAFPDAMEQLERTGFVEILQQQAAAGKPLLGICLGMQALFQKGYEGRECDGLGLIPGFVRKIHTALKLPHIGWNSLSLCGNSPLGKKLQEGDYVYFVHSFCAETPDEYLTAATEYGEKVTAMVTRGNVFGCQFHPEKSGAPGPQILRNFGELTR